MFKRVLAAVVPAVIAAVPVSAATIDFGSLSGSNNDPLGTYNEDGFTVTSLNDMKINVTTGNPAPVILGQGFFLGADGTSSFRLTAAGGAAFFLSSYDIRPGSGTTDGQPPLDYEIAGTLNGNTVFDLSGQEANNLNFLTRDPGTGAALVDTVTFSFLHRGNLYMIDNIVVDLPTSEVPEPTTLALLGLGLAGLAAARRRI